MDWICLTSADKKCAVQNNVLGVSIAVHFGAPAHIADIVYEDGEVLGKGPPTSLNCKAPLLAMGRGVELQGYSGEWGNEMKSPECSVRGIVSA